jgi:hypothetical protein
MERRERRNFEGMQVEHVVTIPCVLRGKSRAARCLGLANIHTKARFTALERAINGFLNLRGHFPHGGLALSGAFLLLAARTAGLIRSRPDRSNCVW